MTIPAIPVHSDVYDRMRELYKVDDLIVDELDSVGLVAAGANGPADILITKSVDGGGGDEQSATPDPASALHPRRSRLRRLLDWLTLKDDDGASDVDRALAFVELIEADVEKQRNIAEMTEAHIHASFTSFADELFGNGRITRDERKALSSAIGAALDAYTKQLEDAAPDLYGRDPYLDERPGDDVRMAQDDPTSTLDPESDTKEAHEMPDITLSDEIRAALDDDVKAYVEQLEKDLEAAGSDPEPEQNPTQKADDVYKGLPDDVVELLKERDVRAAEEISKANERAESAEAIAKAERDKRVAKEYVERAAEFGHIAKAEDLGPVLQAAAENRLEDEDVERLEGWLKAANAALDTSEFYREFGSAAPAEGSALATIAKKAEELRATDPSLSQEQAEARVMQADPKLAKRADDEERDRTGSKVGR